MPATPEVIAEYLRLKARRLGSAVPYSEETKALCTVSRTRTDLVAARVAATNQLAALVDVHWPGAKEVFADIATFEMPPHDTDDKGRVTFGRTCSEPTKRARRFRRRVRDETRPGSPGRPGSDRARTNARDPAERNRCRHA